MVRKMWKVLYRLHFDVLHIFIFLLIGIIIFKFPDWTKKFWESVCEETMNKDSYRKKYGVIRNFFKIFAVIIFLVNVLPLLSTAGDYSHLKDLYEEGKYNEVIGTVEDFRTSLNYETFNVDRFTFTISTVKCRPGYTKVRLFGGVIKGNGQKVLIRYVPYKGHKYIVFISGYQ